MKKQLILLLSLYALSPVIYGMDDKTKEQGIQPANLVDNTEAPVSGTPPAIRVIAPEDPTTTMRGRSQSPHHHHQHSRSHSPSTTKIASEQLQIPSAPNSEDQKPTEKLNPPIEPTASITAPTPHDASTIIPTAQAERPIEKTGTLRKVLSSLIAAPGKVVRNPKMIWYGINNTGDFARRAVIILLHTIWGKKPQLQAYEYHLPFAPGEHHETLHRREFKRAIETQGLAAQDAFKYRIKRTFCFTTIAAAITSALASRNFNAKKTAALGLGVGTLTSIISWLYHGKRAQINEIARRHHVIVLHAVRENITDQEAKHTYNEAISGVKLRDQLRDLCTYWPAGISEMSGIRNEVTGCYRLLQEDARRTEEAHRTVVHPEHTAHQAGQ